MCYLYKITNIRNGKIYIGKTGKGIDHRWASHCRSAKRGKISKFKCAIRKYGQKAFKVECVSKCKTNDEANKREINLIKYWKMRARLYNVTDGGDGVLGFKWSKKSRLKLSKSQIGRRHSKETKIKMSKSHIGLSPWNKGKRWCKVNYKKTRLPFSKQWKLNMSKAKIGKNNPMYGRRKINGKWVSRC